MYTSNPVKFSEIDHTADVGLRAEGDNLSELFANLAFGMIFIVTGEVILNGKIALNLEIKEKSEEDLIVSWLSEINYHLIVHHFLPAAISELIIRKLNNGFLLTASLLGMNTQNQPVEMNTEIKAVTYHQLRFGKQNDKYVGQVIFDI